MPLRTYAVKLRAPMKIAGVDFSAEEQVAAITCEINPYDLLGLVQYYHAELVEVTAEEEASESETEEDETSVEAESDSVSAPEPASEPAAESPSESTVAESASTIPAEETPAVDGMALFLADGLEEKIAKALIDNGINSPDELRTKLADPAFNLRDLNDIGDTRIQKITAIYVK